MTETLVASAFTLAFELLRTHLNKPEGWKPSPQEIAEFLAGVDAATPEAEKAAARARLNLPQEPQAPV